MYVDVNGDWVIDPQFKGADIFCEQRARVKYSGEDGELRTFVKPDGSLVTPEMFAQASHYSEGKVWTVLEDDYPKCMDLEGKVLFGAQDADLVTPYHDGLSLFVVLTDGEYLFGFYDAEGNVALPPSSQKYLFFSEGLCAATMAEGDQFGFINKAGEWIINPQFDRVSETYGFQDGRCAVSTDGREWGVIDKTGKFVVNPQFQDIEPDIDAYRIKLNGKYGWCGEDGTISINPQWSETGFFYGHDLAPVKVGRKWGYVDEEGKLEVNPQFDMAFSFMDGKAWVQIGDKWGVINEDGKYLTNPQFEMVEYDLSEALFTHHNPGYYRGGRNSDFFIESDYFDVQDVLNRMDPDTPEGHTLGSTTYGELDEEYDLSSRKFTNRLVKMDLSSDVELRFYSYGNSHKKYTDRSGWYDQTKYRLDPERVPDGYSMRFRLSGRGKDKADVVYRAMLDNMGGFKTLNSDQLDENQADRLKWYDRNYSYNAITLFQNDEKIAAVVQDDDNNVWMDVWMVVDETEE